MNEVYILEMSSRRMRNSIRVVRFTAPHSGNVKSALLTRRVIPVAWLSGCLTSWTLNVDAKSVRHSRICLSIHQRWLPFFFHGRKPPPGILLLIEFPRWNFIPDIALSPSLPLVVLSRETISQPSFLTGFLSKARLTLSSFPPYVSSLMPAPVSCFSDNRSFMQSREAFSIKTLKCSQSHGEEEASFAKRGTTLNSLKGAFRVHGIHVKCKEECTTTDCSHSNVAMCDTPGD